MPVPDKPAPQLIANHYIRRAQAELSPPAIPIYSSVMDKASDLPAGTRTGETPVQRPNQSGCCYIFSSKRRQHRFCIVGAGLLQPFLAVEKISGEPAPTNTTIQRQGTQGILTHLTLAESSYSAFGGF